MQPIAELRQMGYQVALQGDQIKWQWGGSIAPDKKKAIPLLAEVKQHKAEALVFLRNEAKSPQDSVALSRGARQLAAAISDSGSARPRVSSDPFDSSGNPSLDCHASAVSEALKTFPGSKLAPVRLQEVMGKPENRTSQEWKQIKNETRNKDKVTWSAGGSVLDHAKSSYANASIRFLEAKNTSEKKIWKHIVETMSFEDEKNLVEYFQRLERCASGETAIKEN